MRPLPSIVTALVLAWGTTAMAQTYDLHQDYRKRVGDRIRHTDLDRTANHVTVAHGERVLRDQEETKGQELVYVLEALATDGEDVTHGTIDYESFRDLSTGEAVDVTGLRVEFRRGEDETYGYEVVSGALPAPLRLILDKDMKSRSQSAEERRETTTGALLADRPVAVGEPWEVPEAKALKCLGLPMEGLDPEASFVRGTLQSVERRDEAEVRTIQIDMHLVFPTFQGVACEEPMTITFVMKLRLSPDGAASSMDADGSMRGRLAPPGAPPGVLATFDNAFEKVGRRERARAETDRDD